MRPGYPEVLEVLSQVPGCNQRTSNGLMTASYPGLMEREGIGPRRTCSRRSSINLWERTRHSSSKGNQHQEPALAHTLQDPFKNPSLDETESKDISLTTLFSASSC
ncbi:Exportin 5 [Caligus rogercresseyi]|uniref:Exportin 5 n=1 Tax=Caligus rogercresseyi TaxID=217165 RepID=A0A7T8KL94_CALRO|nr:Exportin 5 [Caligus rogercresseyi]